LPAIKIKNRTLKNQRVRHPPATSTLSLFDVLPQWYHSPLTNIVGKNKLKGCATRPTHYLGWLYASESGRKRDREWAIHSEIRESIMEISSDQEIRRIPNLIRELYKYVLYDEDPNSFISDEATIWDVSMALPEDLLQRVSEYYGKPLTLAELKQPLWKLLRQLNEGRASNESS
jgi:hypothetical protein